MASPCSPASWNGNRRMIVFPAIDLKGGQVVRLAEGDMDRATVYGDNPAAQAMIFAEAGSQFLHVVDLDGSFAGRAENRAAVEAILSLTIKARSFLPGFLIPQLIPEAIKPFGAQTPPLM